MRRFAMRAVVAGSLRRNGVAIVALSLLLCAVNACSLRHHGDTATLRLGDSLTYRGQVEGGKPEGLGVLMRGGRVVYSGRWRRGLRHGEGCAADSLGREVWGTWRGDSLLTASREDSLGAYSGEMDGDLRPHGYGRYRDASGTYYEGQWDHGSRSGFGFSSRNRFFRVGEWRRDVFRGERLTYNAERVYGIDISKYQHERGRKRHAIAWDRLRVTHLGSLSDKRVSGKVDFKVSFIFLKSTEGKTLVNPYYAADYAAARRHGYAVGTYHFFSHLTPAADQARHFIAHSRVDKGDLPPVLDLEPLPSQVEAMGGAEGMWRRVRVWLRMVEEATGMRPILYISQAFVNRWLDAAPDVKAAYPVWIARYGEYKPDVRLWIWQLAPDGRVSGIVGETDINVFNGYAAEFGRWKESVCKK